MIDLVVAAFMGLFGGLVEDLDFVSVEDLYVSLLKVWQDQWLRLTVIGYVIFLMASMRPLFISKVAKALAEAVACELHWCFRSLVCCLDDWCNVG